MQTATVPVEAELDAPVDRIASPDVGGVLPVAHASKPLDAASPVETRADAFEARPPMAVDGHAGRGGASADDAAPR